MANTLTGLIPTIFEAMEIVSREMVGFIPAVTLSNAVDRVGLNQTINVPVAGTSSLADNTPGVSAPNTGDTTDGTVALTVDKSKHYPIRFNGEEQVSLGSANYNELVRQKVAQGIRALVNAIELDLAAQYIGASRAYGSAGTTPFGTKDVLTDFAGIAQILDDNGAPTTDRQLVLGSNAMFNLRGVQSGILQKVNEAGSDAALRMGLFGEVSGLTIRNSAQVRSHTKGTGSGLLINESSGYAIGDTALTTDTGTGTVLAGDVVTFTGDTNKYVVGSPLAANVVTLNKPGLKATLANNVALTVGNSFTANLAFHRNALLLAARLPAIPDGGDSADDRMTITDPFTGLNFEFALYRQYRQVHMEIGLAWGTKAINSRHMAILLG